MRAPPKFFCLLHHEYPYGNAEETLGTTTNNYFSVTLSEDSSFGYNLHAWLFFLVLFPPLSFFWVLFISIYGKHIFASLLQTYTTHRIVDFIIAEKVQQCICPWGAIMTAHTECNLRLLTTSGYSHQTASVIQGSEKQMMGAHQQNCPVGSGQNLLDPLFVTLTLC